MRSIFSLLCFFSLLGATAQWTGEVDSASDVLIKNRYVEIEATQAMYDMYNMDFVFAEQQFQYLKKQYGWHPLPDFLIGLNYWWRLVPYGAVETPYDERFLAYMDSSLVKAERLYEEVNEIEGAFFLAATYGFQGRLYSERGEYLKASFAGRNALKYLEISRGKEDFSPELLFGDGLFNYYAEWIPENYPMLKPIMAFFPDGDKELGKEQLEETSRNAFYARTEAQYFLMRILYAEEGDLIGAMQLAKYLYELYPNNSYFHWYYARLKYRVGDYEEAIELCNDIIERVDNEKMGYVENVGRFGAFFLGHMYEIKRDYELSKSYFEKSITYSEAAQATERGYYYYSWLHLGTIAERQGDDNTALSHYKKVRKITKSKHPANKSAKKKISDLKKKV